MRIDVVGRHFTLTDAIREHASKKALKLERYSDQIQNVTVTIDGQDHHHSGEYGVELVVDVPRHDDFIAKAQDQDVYQAIDQVVQKGTRQLADFKDKLKTENR